MQQHTSATGRRTSIATAGDAPAPIPVRLWTLREELAPPGFRALTVWSYGLEVIATGERLPIVSRRCGDLRAWLWRHPTYSWDGLARTPRTEEGGAA